MSLRRYLLGPRQEAENGKDGNRRERKLCVISIRLIFGILVFSLKLTLPNTQLILHTLIKACPPFKGK